MVARKQLAVTCRTALTARLDELSRFIYKPAIPR